MLREVRLALLEADVALPVVREFTARVKEKALGQDVVGSLTPWPGAGRRGATRTRRLMGGDAVPINLATQPPAIVLMAGLQGAGKPPPPPSWRGC
jgi:signal recognition particle subunit FFH/SRP54 (srp54)